MRICVYGAAADGSQKVMNAAREIGRMIGRHGHSLTYGGFSKGVLGEVAKGAAEYGAEILAVVPEEPRKGQPLFYGCTCIERSSDKRMRKKMQVDHADFFIVLPTGIGVMDELFEVIVLKSYGQLNHKVLICNIDGCYDTLLTLLREQGADDLVDSFCDTEQLSDYLS